MKFSRYYAISVGLIVILVGLSFGLYSIESTQPGSRINSFGDAFWYMIVTMTTVGYGDVYPVTVLGRIIGAGFVVGSLGVLGFLIGQVAEIISSIRERRRLGLNGINFTNHVVIIGWNDLSQIVADKLLQGDRNVAFVIEKKENFEIAESHFKDTDVFLTYDDSITEETLDRVNLKDSSTVFVNRPGDAENLITLLSINEYAPDAQTIICAYNEELIRTFNSAGATYVLSRQDILAQIISNYIESPHEEVFTEAFIEEAQEEGVFQVSG